MLNKKKYLFMVIAIMLVIIGTGTFAWLSYRTNNTAMVLTVGDIDHMQITIEKYHIKREIAPELTYDLEDDDAYVSVVAVNNSSIGMLFDLFYQINTIDSALANSNFKYTVLRSTDGGNSYTEYGTGGNFSGKTDNSVLDIFDDEFVPANSEYRYKVFVWLYGNTNNSGTQGKVFNGELRAEIVGGAKAYLTDTLADYTNNDAALFHEPTYRNKIVSASFVDYVDTTGAVKTYDMGMYSNKPITGWLIKNNNSDTYNLYIGSDYVIYTTDLTSFFRNMTGLAQVSFDNLNTSENTSLRLLFGGCSGMTTLDMSNFDTSNVTDMFGTFVDMTNLTSLDLSGFDTSKVTNMRVTFSGMTNLTSLDLSTFDTSNVTDMAGTFQGCNSLTTLDLSNFDTSKVTDMQNMFYRCISLTTLDLSSFDTSKVTTMRGMFQRCTFTSLNISSFNTTSLTDMYGMFVNCINLISLDLSSFDTSNVTDMLGLFDSCTGLISINFGNNFDTSNVNTMSYMFQNCSSLSSLNLGSKFNTVNVTSMSYMFKNCSNLSTLNLGSNFDTSKVTTMESMFVESYNDGIYV